MLLDLKEMVSLFYHALSYRNRIFRPRTHPILRIGDPSFQIVSRKPCPGSSPIRSRLVNVSAMPQATLQAQCFQIRYLAAYSRAIPEQDGVHDRNSIPFVMISRRLTEQALALWQSNNLLKCRTRTAGCTHGRRFARCKVSCASRASSVSSEGGLHLREPAIIGVTNVLFVSGCSRNKLPVLGVAARSANVILYIIIYALAMSYSGYEQAHKNIQEYNIRVEHLRILQVIFQFTELSRRTKILQALLQSSVRCFIHSRTSYRTFHTFLENFYCIYVEVETKCSRLICLLS